VDRLEEALRGLLTDERLRVDVVDKAAAIITRGARRRRRARVVAGAGAGLVVVGLTVGGLVATGVRDRAHPPTPDSQGLATGTSWRVGTPIPLPADAGAVTAMSGFGSTLWVTTAGRRLFRIDEVARRALVVPTSGAPLAVGYTPEQVWVVTGSCRLLQLSPATTRTVRSYTLPCRPGSTASFAVVADGQAAWVSVSSAGSPSTTVVRVDGLAHRETTSVNVAGRAIGGRPLTLGGADVLIVTQTADLSVLTSLGAIQLGPQRSAVLPIRGAATLAYEDRLYVSVQASPGAVLAYDPATLEAQRVLDSAATDVTTADPLAWLLLPGADSSPDRLLGLIALTHQPVAQVALPRGRAEHVVSDGDTVWVAMSDPTGRQQLVPVSEG
jgi:hypothetical protein